MENSQYTLYVKAGCPFCAKVLNFMDEHDIVLPIMDISLEPYKDGYDKLINLGGKYQVPCLDIDGKALYESDDIIAYLNKTFVEKNAGKTTPPKPKETEPSGSVSFSFRLSIERVRKGSTTLLLDDAGLLHKLDR